MELVGVREEGAGVRQRERERREQQKGEEIVSVRAAVDPQAFL